MYNIVQYIQRTKPLASKRNKENGVASEVVSGLVYCRERRMVTRLPPI